jgi:hypothetical protein
MMRMALAQALHHARHRVVFQLKLADQPMMRMLLADMALEVEGATALMMRLCRSFDLAASDAGEAARARVLTPAVKYWVCKTAPAFIYEAMECLGGNGYVEETPLARLYREAPVNAIWEGSGNVMCLDVLRALSREGEAARAVLADLVRACGDLPGAREAAGFIATILSGADGEARARAAVERLAMLAAAAALAESVPGVAEAFARTRLATPRGGTFGSSALADNDVCDTARSRACGSLSAGDMGSAACVGRQRHGAPDDEISIRRAGTGRRPLAHDDKCDQRIGLLARPGLGHRRGPRGGRVDRVGDRGASLLLWSGLWGLLRGAAILLWRAGRLCAGRRGALWLLRLRLRLRLLRLREWLLRQLRAAQRMFVGRHQPLITRSQRVDSATNLLELAEPEFCGSRRA